MNRAFDGLREDAFDVQRFQAWCAGQTGYPMVDACMRALQHSGWINFRMRAMLMSVASYQQLATSNYSTGKLIFSSIINTGYRFR